jgi:hypothetical protein
MTYFRTVRDCGVMERLIRLEVSLLPQTPRSRIHGRPSNTSCANQSSFGRWLGSRAGGGIPSVGVADPCPDSVLRRHLQADCRRDGGSLDASRDCGGVHLEHDSRVGIAGR